jgi:hypothetical protein
MVPGQEPNGQLPVSQPVSRPAQDTERIPLMNRTDQDIQIRVAPHPGITIKFPSIHGAAPRQRVDPVRRQKGLNTLRLRQETMRPPDHMEIRLPAFIKKAGREKFINIPSHPIDDGGQALLANPPFKIIAMEGLRMSH